MRIDVLAVRYVAESGLPLDDVAAIQGNNALRLFGARLRSARE
jgi:hypothetical protein